MKASEPENTPQIDMSMHQLRLFIGSAIFGIFFTTISFWTLKKRYKIHLNAIALLVFFRLIVYIMHNQNSLIVHTVSSYRSSSRKLSKTLCNYSTFAPSLIHFKYKSRMIKKTGWKYTTTPKMNKNQRKCAKKLLEYFRRWVSCNFLNSFIACESLTEFLVTIKETFCLRIWLAHKHGRFYDWKKNEHQILQSTKWSFNTCVHFIANVWIMCHSQILMRL